MEKLLSGVAVVTGNAARAAKRRRVFIREEKSHS